MVSAPALRRIAINVVVDAALAAAALLLARWLAAPNADPAPSPLLVAAGMAALLAAGLPFRLSTQYWRFAGMADLLGVAAGAVGAATLFALGVQMAGGRLPSPAFPVIHALTLVVVLAAPRMAYRLLRERRVPDRAGVPARPVLLVGAGEGADLFLSALLADPAPPWRAVGLLSLGQAQTGRRIQGVPVLGSLPDAAKILAGLGADDAKLTLVVTDADFSGAAMAGLVAAAEAVGARVARAPRPTALTQDRFALRPVAIEELLGRPQVPLDRAGMARLIEGRLVLVTGAGGTIGSELARQVAALAPSELVLLDNGEHALWQIDMEIGESFPTLGRRALLADVRDAERLLALMQGLRPALVFHAAALKHVPMVEANPLEGLLTNACGTRHVADAARAAGVTAMVMISTDKAVNPSSVMGATKRLAEMYCQGLDAGLDAGRDAGGGGMACVTVRFGNVLGSTGSVVPVFQRQLARGGPLTVTHPDMQRYFMTVREAVSLVLQASVDGVTQRERRGIFVLDMGEPVKIVDLARQMIRLAGLRPDIDVPIVFTGPRPGEKLFEELFHGREPTVATGTPGLLMANPRTADAALVGRAIDEIEVFCRAGHAGAALAALGRTVPEFAPDRDAA